jgi:hypothetical protein
MDALIAPIRRAHVAVPYLAALCLVFTGCGSSAWAETVVVHEWGTLTVLQDDLGVGVGGINIDDEPVPRFVHDAAPGHLACLNDLSLRLDSKGYPEGDPAVTMRLETPVIYVHPGTPEQRLQMRIQVDFHGGWLTQYYPQATVTLPGHVVQGFFQFAPLTAGTTSSLCWPELTVGEATVPAVETAEPVWVAPRRVACANVRAGAEGERFLFYRGLAHLDAPVAVRRSANGRLSIAMSPGLDPVARFCLVDIQADGSVAFRVIAGSSAAPIDAGSELFPAASRSQARRAELRAVLAQDLTGAGLFADEAEALLNTWDASYFRSPGLRLFFLMPRAWVDRVLPLRITPHASIERAVLGRIELVSTEDRACLDRIAAGPTSSAAWYDAFLDTQVYNDAKSDLRPGGRELIMQLSTQPGALARLHLAVPGDYAAYLALGRFREAILRHELERRPSAPLTAFARAYGILPEPAHAAVAP